MEFLFNTIEVADLDKSYEFYNEILNLEVVRKIEPEKGVKIIFLEDEEEKFVGILLYDKAQYDSDLRDWKNYWEWRKNRNESRYKSQEDGEIDYDAKNIHHCFRLLYSGKNILKYGEPIVRFEGEKLQFLKDIRNGKYSYEYLMNLVESEMQEMDSLKESSNLPKSPNMKKIEKLYREFYG